MFIMTKKKSSPKSREDFQTCLQDLSVRDVGDSQKRTSKKSKTRSAADIAKEGQQIVKDMEMQKPNSEDEAQNDPQSGMKRKRKKSPVVEDRCAHYNELHVDLWTVIGTYIRPEDVGNFAGICRTTAFVVSRAGFWYSLYDRYCRNFFDMPHELRSWEIRSSGVQGLRSRVVRSLFLAYKPLARTRDAALVKSVSIHIGPKGVPAFDFDRLLHSRCTGFSSKRRNSCYQYVFELYHSNRIPNQALFGTEFWKSSHEPMAMPPACQHKHDGCFLLEIVCSNSCKVDPSILGLKLQVINEKPSEITNCSKNKITLLFSQSTFTQNTRWDEGVKMVLQPVLTVQVVPWWDQKYYSTIWASQPAADGHDTDIDDAWEEV